MKHSKTLLFALVLLVSQALAQTAAAPAAPPQGMGPGHVGGANVQVAYTVSLASAAEHMVHVSVRVRPVPPEKLCRMQLPVWNALYQVRDFAQFVRAAWANDDTAGHPPVRKLDKTTWEVEAAGRPFTFEYDILADTADPFGAQLSSQHAFFNFAEVLMYPVGMREGWIQLTFADVPAGWKIATALPQIRTEGLYLARNYDELVDSPVEMGAFHESDFNEGGAHYRVVVDADPADYDLSTISGMARKLTRAEVEWMQDRPFDHYVFIYHFPRRAAGGGMEHAYSSAIDAPADRVKKDPMSLAGVTAHEFFHLWNVKRIRPQSLEPVDYTKEQYTRALWFSEGVTSTVADYMLVRAGLMDEKKYLQDLANSIRWLESRPARLTQSMEESSLDAWLEKYSYYSQPDRSISYYNKGEIVGVLLDLTVREASSGKKSLRDVFQWMNQHYAKQGKFFPDSAGVQQAAEAVSGANLGSFFSSYVAGVAPLPYDELFATVGLRLESRTRTVASLGFATSRRYSQAPVVTSVEAGSEAERVGLKSGDVVQEFNGKLVVGPLEPLLAGLRAGDFVHLKLSGGRDLKIKLGSREQSDYALVELPNATAAQRARRAAWIRGDSQP